jgi:hypothetical protein
MQSLPLATTVFLAIAALLQAACGPDVVPGSGTGGDENGEIAGENGGNNAGGGNNGGGGSNKTATSSAKGGSAGASGGGSSAKGGGGSGGSSSGKGGGGSSHSAGSNSGGGSSSAGAGGMSVPPSPPCSKDGAWKSSDPWGQDTYDDKYTVRNNFWNQSAAGSGNETIWAKTSRCWGVDASHTDADPKGTVKGYPDIARGWTIGNNLGNNGLAIQVSKLKKAKIRWKMTAPTTGRTWGLWDIYFHTSENPSGDKAPVNLMIQQRIVDSDGWMQSDSSGWTKVTIAGIKFREKLETSTVSSTRNRIQLYIDYGDGRVLGRDDMVFDLKAIIDHYVEGGQIKSTDWLTSIQAGWEIVSGGTYQTDDFWTALNDEPEPS